MFLPCDAHTGGGENLSPLRRAIWGGSCRNGVTAVAGVPIGTWPVVRVSREMLSAVKLGHVSREILLTFGEKFPRGQQTKCRSSISGLSTRAGRGITGDPVRSDSLSAYDVL